MPTQHKLALVIGSGSVMCAASAGMLKVLDQAGAKVSLFVGSSGGSIYAALAALGVKPETIQEMSFRLWTAELFQGYASNLRATLSGEMQYNEFSGLIDDRPMMERLAGIFGEKTFNDCQTPLAIVSTELYSGESVVHDQGRLLDVIRASIAIPLIFPPWQIDGQWLVDGAVSNPLPVDVAIQKGADIILAMGFELPTRKKMRSYTAVTTHFNAIYMNNIMKNRFAFSSAVHHAEIIPVIPEFKRSISTFEVDQIPYIVAEGERAAEAELPYIMKLLNTPTQI